MKFFFSASFFALATAVAAAPGYGPSAGTPPSLTNEQAIAKCGNANLSCCNKEINKVNAQGVDSDFGVLNGLLKNANIQDISVFDQCSKLDVGVGVLGAGLTDLLNQKCKQTAACCQNNKSEANGLVALAVPCIPLNVL
ncbi:hypothetical protein PRK78_001496 [Emydomyces testavorans]|uniref:Hydrophobin n=1 Tax=Emydomyces testavorans TaxID=2070801 RepID=A0AAF0DE73_9EURO|nr:hypothetical protein PRK78_001496 [Emydomyces testavorans]